jgi:Transglycosylase SLT domain
VLRACSTFVAVVASATCLTAAAAADGGLGAHIRDVAARYGVPERLVTAIIRVESDFNPRAVSHRGARGLMQLMPTTAAVLGVRDAFDPTENLHAGVRHLRTLIDRFDNNLPLALAAYNAGEQAVLRHGGIPPYPETQEYVERILRLLTEEGARRATVTARAEPQVPPPPPTKPGVRYRPSAVLARLALGQAKTTVLDALATEWVKERGGAVKVPGAQIKASMPTGHETVIEVAELRVAERHGPSTTRWLLFEDGRLLAVGGADDWPAAVVRYALVLDWSPDGAPSRTAVVAQEGP